MATPLRVLHLEDDPDYAKLVQDLLLREGVSANIQWVKDQGEFEGALDQGSYDVILADYQLPDYTGLRALALARVKMPDTPFLLVSGTIGEHAAIEGLRAGATDYVLKQWPERLVPALRRAVQESRDQTSHWRADKVRSNSDTLFRLVWESSSAGMMLTDENGIVTAANEALCKLTGLGSMQLEGKPFTAFYGAAEEPQTILAVYKEHFRNRTMEPQTEKRIALHDGRFIVLNTNRSFVNPSGRAPLLLSILRDVTMQKRLEDQFRQSQKMEAVSQFARGMAHDFNNILTVIHGHASLMAANNSLPPPAAKSAAQVVQAATRASGLTRQLLTFGRRQVMDAKPKDLNEILGKMAKMLDGICGAQIAVQPKFWSKPVLIQADTSMIEEMLLNIALNARDAMPKGGQLDIKLNVIDFDPALVAAHPESRPGRFVCISVVDTGRGIPYENLGRIFEPFFTTKEIGRGAGLGLATVFGIVKQHQGWIEVQSEVDQGTTFDVYLPVVADTQKKSETEITKRAGSQMVLVVEDEQTVREYVAGLLSSQGYQVLEAQSGVKALQLWSQYKKEINLLLADLVLPDGMNGRELAEKLMLEKPELKVIFTSGYSADEVGNEFATRPGLSYLQKPYHPQKLATAVRDCLGKTA